LLERKKDQGMNIHKWEIKSEVGERSEKGRKTEE
jgi:hypothetical protein